MKTNNTNSRREFLIKIRKVTYGGFLLGILSSCSKDFEILNEIELDINDDLVSLLNKNVRIYVKSDASNTNFTTQMSQSKGRIKDFEMSETYIKKRKIRRTGIRTNIKVSGLLLLNNKKNESLLRLNNVKKIDNQILLLQFPEPKALTKPINNQFEVKIIKNRWHIK